MLKYIGASANISSNPEDIEESDKLILPGVGAFDAGMSKLQSSGLVEILNQKVLKSTHPFLVYAWDYSYSLIKVKKVNYQGWVG